MNNKPILPKALTLVLLLAAVLVLAALLLLPEKEFAALPEPSATPIPPTPTPATQDEAVRDAVEEALRYVATFQGGDDPALILPFVSTGEFDTLTFDLDRQPVQTDVVYAYTVNAARQLLIVPVAIGAVFPDGVYRSFDVLAYGKPTDTATRQQAALVLSEAAANFDVTETLRELEEEMLAAANNLEFEKAALLRDQIRELKRQFGEAGGPAKAAAAKAGTVSYRSGRKRR